MGRLGLLFKIFREFTSIIHLSKALVYSITFLSVISVSFSVTACSPDNTTSSWDYTTEPRATREFMFNYDLLRFHYNDAKKYLGDPEDYIGKIKDSALAEYNVPWDYYDIYYMYYMMNDPHTQYVDPAHSVLLLDKLNSSEQKMDAGFQWEKQGLSNNYVITSVVKNSSADKNGLKVGDQIIAIGRHKRRHHYIHHKTRFPRTDFTYKASPLLHPDRRTYIQRFYSRHQNSRIYKTDLEQFRNIR